MSIEFRATTLADYARIEMNGPFSLDAVLPLCDRCFRYASDAGRDAMLVDIRGVTGREPTMAERYEWAVRIAELQAAYLPRIRIAVLGREPLIHPERFGEIVAMRHGAVMRIFIEEDLALGWLVGGSAAP